MSHRKRVTGLPLLMRTLSTRTVWPPTRCTGSIDGRMGVRNDRKKRDMAAEGCGAPARRPGGGAAGRRRGRLGNDEAHWQWQTGCRGADAAKRTMKPAGCRRCRPGETDNAMQLPKRTANYAAGGPAWGGDGASISNSSRSSAGRHPADPGPWVAILSMNGACGNELRP